MKIDIHTWGDDQLVIDEKTKKDQYGNDQSWLLRDIEAGNFDVLEDHLDFIISDMEQQLIVKIEDNIGNTIIKGL